MEIKTSRGKELDVDFAVLSNATGRLIIRLEDERSISEIASDFDGLSDIEVERDNARIPYDGPFTLTGIDRFRSDGKVTITMKKEL